MDALERKARILTAQFLSRKGEKRTVASALCGVQAQYFNNAKHALKIRCHDVGEEDWGGGMLKIWAQRGTLHVINAEDYGLFMSAKRTNMHYVYQHIPKAQADALAEELFAHVAQGRGDRAALKKLYLDNGMDSALADAAFSGWGGLMSVLSTQGRIVFSDVSSRTFAVAPAFERIDRQQALTELVRRYFAAYGPTGIQDAAHFFTLSQSALKPCMDRLDLNTCTVDGEELFYLGDITPCEIPDCLFLAGFDQALIGYKTRRSPFIDPALVPRVYTQTGIIFPTVLLRGNVCAIWKEEKNSVAVTPLVKILVKDKKRVERAAHACALHKPVVWQS